MHKLRNHDGQEAPRKLCKLGDLLCLTPGGLMCHQNAEHSGLESPQEFNCALCDYTASKNTPLANTESKNMVFLTRRMKRIVTS